MKKVSNEELKKEIEILKLEIKSLKSTIINMQLKNKVITNQDLYNENKEEVRADFSAFESEVYKTEDELNASNTRKVGK